MLKEDVDRECENANVGAKDDKNSNKMKGQFKNEK